MAQRRTFARDGGLQLRMAITIFLLGAVYVGLIALLFALGASGITIAVVAGGMFLFQFLASDKLALRAAGAREVSPQEAPQFHAMIERLAKTADLPKPRVAIAESSIPNAFAMGRSRKASTVCATTGIMEILTEAELEGVMAHELTHVRNRDVLIMTVASFFASIAAFIMQFGFFFGGGDDEEGPGFLAVFFVSMLVYAISFFLMQALSRYREFAADRGAAEITGKPLELASALMKISGKMEHLPARQLHAASEMNAFFIIPAKAKQSLASLFSTHPPVEKRVAALKALNAQSSRVSGLPNLGI